MFYQEIGYCVYAEARNRLISAGMTRRQEPTAESSAAVAQQQQGCASCSTRLYRTTTVVIVPYWVPWYNVVSHPP